MDPPFKKRRLEKKSFIYELPNDKTNKMAWVSSEDSDQPGSDQSLHCPHEESLGPELPIECMAKTLIRLHGYPG